MKRWSTLLLSLVLASASLVSYAKDRDTAITRINFSTSVPSEGNLVLGIYQDNELGQYGQAIDDKTNGGLKHAIKASKFEAQSQKTTTITAPMGSGYNQILLVGLGKRGEDKTNLEWQKIGGNAVQAAVKAFKQAPAMLFDVSGDASAHIAYGANLGSYYFDKYYTDEKRKKHQAALTIINSDSTAAAKRYKSELEPVAKGIWHTRNMSNEPANVIYPESFVAQWKQHFKGMKNIKIRVIDEDDMLDMGMGAIYGVGQGSKRPPRMMIVEYMGGNKGDAPIAIVGKGITFDTGGISIKGSNNMWNMKFDMSGAASTMGTLYALAGRKAKVNVVGVAALAENMPSGSAQRPGDVVTSMSGKTIQIRSTDAEGRLVLADAMYYADTKYNPSLLVDLATLTGSASRALGKDYAAMFSRHDDLAEKFSAAGKLTGDEVWRLPLNKNHFKAIKNNVADIMNSGPKAPGASAGAAFVGTFVRDTTPWVHFDIAGVAWGDNTTPVKASPGSTSFGIRLLNGYIKEHFESK
ncbi:leucyl aminopeptidase [Aliikangiella marina]|uniref:Probable cytosol aminopeptidase n=1 Tax=Aliikangiella marina TaxID=1712262 RepID=A0A545TIW5_9GAMM|nr:leucyl aminopeptidase [Aliikangiella marina]TQV77121.1 leucyl aminopeptidase [Aliikangiella marina]